MGDPLEAYEAIRAKIRQELKIVHIQERIRQRIFKVKPEEVELNFYVEEAPDEPSDDMGVLLSPCNAVGLSDGEGSDSAECAAPRVTAAARRRGISSFLNLEAECSADAEECTEEDEIDLRDLVDSGDAENEDAVHAFVADQAKNEDSVLERLKSQFSERKHRKIRAEGKTGLGMPGRSLESLSDEDTFDDLDKIEFTELDQADFLSPESPPAAPVKMDTVAAKAPVGPEADDGLFNNNAAALERLVKKTEKRRFGFKEA